MPARPTFPSASERPLPLEAPALAIPARPAIAALAGLALLMLVAPALVAAIALLDSSFFAGFESWFLGVSAWLASLAHARVLLVLPLAAMVARAKEDS